MIKKKKKSRILKIEKNISDEAKYCFISYAMSVIVSRALPDVRDGLKPVQRRIIFAMYEMGILNNKFFKKSARVVGNVIGKFHPHGDSAIYKAMVRMAQKFSFRYPLIEGHGNFGSIDGDKAAAMRYTEVKMSKISTELISEINKNTVKFIDNYDNEEKEPSILPSKIPNLLINGSTGIAVGLATNIPPHNLNEIINGLLAYVDNSNISTKELVKKYIFAPDFPTGSIILKNKNILKIYKTGKGSIIIRSKAKIFKNKNKIIITEIPYQINKSSLIEKIVLLIKNKALIGIKDIRDESSHNKIKIVIELKKHIIPKIILNQLYSNSILQTVFSVNMQALVNGKAELLNLKKILICFLNFRYKIIKNRIKYDLKINKKKLHITKGLIIALKDIDKVIKIIKNSKNDIIARTKLLNFFNLSIIQSKSILEMKLKRLTNLRQSNILLKYKNLKKDIKKNIKILNSKKKLTLILKNELIEIKKKYSDKRKTKIITLKKKINDEDLIVKENIVIILTKNGYIKKMPIKFFNIQKRGGKGIRGISTYKNDKVMNVLSLSSHDYVLFFSNNGLVYKLKAFEIPFYNRISKGIPILNLLKLKNNNFIKILAVKKKNDHKDFKYIFFVTKLGFVKKVLLSNFNSIKKNGKIAISLKKNDELISIHMTNGISEIIIAASNGKAVRFNENEIRSVGRNACGVRGIKLINKEVVVGSGTSLEGKYVFAITKNGYGKRTKISKYRKTKRGAKGVKAICISKKNGELFSLRVVNNDENVFIISNNNIIIRFLVKNIRICNRVTLGVKLINVNDSFVSSVAILKNNKI